MTTYFLIMMLTSTYSATVSPVPFASLSLCEQAGKRFVEARDGLLTHARYICVEAGNLNG